MRGDARAILEENSIPVPECGCMLWLRGQSAGYGSINYEGRTKYAHRLAYETFKGPVGSLHVLHKCDTRSCINPDHLFLGTIQDNILDAVSKGRLKGIKRNFQNRSRVYVIRGEELSGRRKVKHSQRKEIADRLMAGEKIADLALEFGVTKTTICSYRHRV